MNTVQLQNLFGELKEITTLEFWSSGSSQARLGAPHTCPLPSPKQGKGSAQASSGGPERFVQTEANRGDAQENMKKDFHRSTFSRMTEVPVLTVCNLCKWLNKCLAWLFASATESIFLQQI